MVMLQHYFGPDCPPELVEQADVEVVVDGEKLPAHSQILARASPIFAGCLLSCSNTQPPRKRSKSTSLKQLPIEGRAEIMRSLLTVVYARDPKSCCEG